MDIQEKFFSKFDSLRNEILNQLEENIRLRWFVAFAFIMLYLGTITFLINSSNQASQKYNLALSELSRVNNQTSEQSWPDRALRARNMSLSLEKRLWKGDTPGLAEAGFERWIRTTLNGYGIEVRRVQLTRGPIQEEKSNLDFNVLSDVQRLRAKVICPLNETGLIRFLEIASKNTSWIVIEKLTIRGGRNARIEMDLATFYQPKV